MRAVALTEFTRQFRDIVGISLINDTTECLKSKVALKGK